MQTNATPPNPAIRRVIEESPDGSRTEYDDIPIVIGSLWENEDKPKLHRLPDLRDRPVEEVGTLFCLSRRLFVDHWDQIVFGPCIEGAVFELQLKEPAAKISMLDGYLTVFFDGLADFHLCISPHRGLGKHKTNSALAMRRQCSRAAFYRIISTSCSPQSWGIRLWNGAGEQMVSFFLPNPFLTEDQKPRKEPDWSRLALWDALRAEFLGETEPQLVPSE